MSDQEKELLNIIKSLPYGEILVKKEAGKIVLVKRTETIKLSEERR
jgi:hypothetical protein